MTLICPSFSVTKIVLSETAIDLGSSRFSAKVSTELFSGFDEGGSGIGKGSEDDVKTNIENTSAAIIPAILSFLSTKNESFQIILITFKNLIKRI